MNKIGVRMVLFLNKCIRPRDLDYRRSLSHYYGLSSRFPRVTSIPDAVALGEFDEKTFALKSCISLLLHLSNHPTIRSSIHPLVAIQRKDANGA